MTTALVPHDNDRPAPVEDAPPRPQYIAGFDGIATEPFPEAARRVLAEEPSAEAIEIKPNGIVFVPGVYWRRQLTRAFGAGGWALAPRGPARVMGQLVVYPGALYCLGRFVAEAIGECAYIASNSQMSYASAVEGAKTDALSRCCKDLGMASQLWDKAWRDRWMDEYAEKGSDGKWRVRSGRPVQSIDLMSGAGGVAPSASASPPAATPSSVPAAAPGDTGEPANDEQKAAIRSQVKRLKWTGKGAAGWLQKHFAQPTPDSLSRVQADAAYLLLNAHGTGAYDGLLAELVRNGEAAA